MADTALQLSARAKCITLFAAAQSNYDLNQTDRAIALNRKAITLLPALKDKDDPFRQRACAQMIDCFIQSGSQYDSVKIYLDRLEVLYHQNTAGIASRFFYERKALYFNIIARPDSSLYYYRLTKDLDEHNLATANKRSAIGKENLQLSYLNIAALFIRLEHYDSSAYFLQLADTLQKKHNLGNRHNQSVVLKTKAAYFFATKQFPAAEKAALAYDSLRQLTFETEQAQATAEMNALYQLQVKDRSIQQLSDSVNTAHIKIQNGRLLLVITLMAALLAIAIAVLLYYIQQQRKLKQEKEKVVLQQQLMRTQMEPHFIFNTLSALQSFIRFDHKEKALKYLGKFSRLLRRSLDLSREERVPLEEEIHALEDYLSLQQMRSNNAFEYKIHIADNAIEGVLLPPMLIQPFVENAVLHGIDNTQKDNHISLSVSIGKQHITVVITDSGNPIPPTGGKQHNSLSNTINRERLELLAKETGLPANVTTGPRKDGQAGTEVILTIPV